MPKCVIGIDLGTSSVKALLVGRDGGILGEMTGEYPLLQPQPGYSEQNPEDWVSATIEVLRQAIAKYGVKPDEVEGISFSGQMHGLVLLDEQMRVLRNAILWNDTRTTPQCRELEARLGDKLLAITKNKALEGFTLPKLLWVRAHEPEIFARARRFLLPKDYVRYRLTGSVQMDISDAAGTLMLDVANKRWSEEICRELALDPDLCPPLAESFACVGELLPEIARQTGLSHGVKVFAGGADNACGAVGAGILATGAAMCSIGTSGVILSYEDDKSKDFRGKVHFFNHAKQDAFYAMGVTLAAGYSLSWLKQTFAPSESFAAFTAGVGNIAAGSNGLLFTPYLVGERTPHADALIRASFIGADGSHTRDHFVRAVMEGITFSLNESVEMFRHAGISVDTIISIGGGAKNDVWMQMQADIFNARIVKLKNEQGPALGAAILAAYGCGWFGSLAECAERFIATDRVFAPDSAAAKTYRELFAIYQDIYAQTKPLNDRLARFR
ncbi:MAG TPA: xylulokinase [Bacilli bacterium]